jgi:hypothetical protein
MEGPLEKKGARRIHGWKRLYFSLDLTTGLLACSSSADRDAAGVGGQATTVRIAGAQDVQNRPGKRQHRFDFLIADGGAAVCCTAPTAADKTAWLVAANSIASDVAAQNKDAPQSPASSSAVTAPAASVRAREVSVVNTPLHMTDV